MTTKEDPWVYLVKRLQHTEQGLWKIATAVSVIDEGAEGNRCLLEQYEEQLTAFRLELFDAYQSILVLDGDVSDLADQEATLQQVMFDSCLKICRLLQVPAPVVH